MLRLRKGSMMRFAVLAISLLSLAAQPAQAASSLELSSLEQQLSALISNKTGDIGIAVLDLKNGASVSIHGDSPYPMASTVKLAVAATYLSQVDAGQRSLADTIAAKPASQLMELMLIHSDNHATDLLISSLGGPRTVQNWLQAHSLTGIRMDRTIAELLRSRRDLLDTRDSSTPKSMIELLRQLDSGTVLKPSSRSYLLTLMSRCATGRNRIKGLLPPATPVEHKTGTLDGLTDDVGFITLPDGRRIAVALFARGGTNRAQTIAEAARAIYDGLAGRLTSSFTNLISVQ